MKTEGTKCGPKKKQNNKMSSKELKEKKKKSDEAENIKVLVRCRPLSTKERDAGYKSSVELNIADGTVTVYHVCGDPDRWTFDAVINNTFKQKDVFDMFIINMIDSVMTGFNATIFAYGQSGSGKTYTMTGDADSLEMSGVIPRSFEYIFSVMKEQASPNRSYNVYCSYLELYNGQAHDLLTKNMASLKIKESKDKTFFVQDLSQPQVKFEADLLRLMEEGAERRRVASTELNSDSSRSHSIFTVYIIKEEISEEGDVRSVTSKLNLVDLAGSERQSKTGTTGETLKEGCNINLSLSALGTVIDTIVKRKAHIPYRSSPLTMLLKDSLGGGSKTCMFANINPSEHNVSETISTLRFADRAKQIKNKPLVQLDAKDQKIAELTTRLEEMREKLKKFEGTNVLKLEEINENLQKQIDELEVTLESQNEELERNKTDTKEALDSATMEIKTMRETIKEITHEADLIKKEKLLLSNQLQSEADQYAELRNYTCLYISNVTGEDTSGLQDPDSIQYQLQLIANKYLSAAPESKNVELENTIVVERKRHEAQLSEAHNEQLKDRERLTEVHQQAQQSLQQALARMEKMKQKIESEREKRRRLNDSKDKEIESLRQAKDSETSKLHKDIEQLEEKLLTGVHQMHHEPTSPAGIPQSIREGMDKQKEEEISIYKQEIEQLHSKITSLLNERDETTSRMTEIVNAGSEDEVTQSLHKELAGVLSQQKSWNETEMKLRDENQSLTHKVQSLQVDNTNLSQQLKTTIQQQHQQAPVIIQRQQSPIPQQLPSNTSVETGSLINNLGGFSNSMVTHVPTEEATKTDNNVTTEELIRQSSMRSQAHTSHTAALEIENAKLGRTIELEKNDRKQQQQEVASMSDRLQEASSTNEELSAELEYARRDLENELSKAQQLQGKQIELLSEVEGLHSEAHTQRQAEDKLRADFEKQRQEFALKIEEVERRNSNVTKIQKQLEEKKTALKNSRQIIKSLQEVVDGLRDKETQQDTKVVDALTKIDEQEKYWQQKLADQESAMAAMVTTRTRELRTQHKHELKKKDHEMERLLKKIRKGESALQKVKERYDRQAVQNEDLTREFETYKLKVLERDNPAGIADTAENIQRIIQTAKVAKILKEEQQFRPVGQSDTTDVETKMLLQSAAARKFSLSETQMQPQQPRDCKSSDAFISERSESRKSDAGGLKTSNANKNRPLHQSPRSSGDQGGGDSAGRREHRLKPVEGEDNKMKRKTMNKEAGDLDRNASPGMFSVHSPLSRKSVSPRDDTPPVAPTAPSHPNSPSPAFSGQPAFASVPLGALGGKTSSPPPQPRVFNSRPAMGLEPPSSISLLDTDEKPNESMAAILGLRPTPPPV